MFRSRRKSVPQTFRRKDQWKISERITIIVLRKWQLIYHSSSFNFRQSRLTSVGLNNAPASFQNLYEFYSLDKRIVLSNHIFYK